MLFDLRSRGRRRTVQAVYLGLAVLMAGGLVLFGVGTGSGIGGLLNAFTGSGYNSATNTYTAAGKKELEGVTTAWQHYSALTKSPSSNTAVLAARAYAQLANYSGAASAWQAATAADPSQIRSFECLAISAYAAKQNRLGDLASAKVSTMVPKASRKTIQTQIDTAKTNPALAQTC